jgi:exopolysaccharide biosynthesis polyprenyl glycosylphosphotransferase
MKPTQELNPASLLQGEETRQAETLDELGVRGHPDAARRSYLIHRLLLGADLLALGLAFGAMIGANVLRDRAAVDADTLVAFGITLPIWILLASVLGLYHLYERRVDHTFADELIPVFLVTTVWAWFFLGVNSGLAEGVTELFGPGVLWGAAIVTVLCARALARNLATRKAWFRQPVMLIGERDDMDRVLARIDRHPECGLDPMFALRLERGRASLHHLDGRPDHVVGPAGRAAAGWNASPEEMAAWIRELDIDRVILAGWASGLGERTDLIRALTSAVISVDVVAAEPEALLSTATLHHLEGLPILTVRPTAITQGSRILKRALDICVAAAGLTILAPLLVYIAIRIKLDSRGPVIFRQQRAGQDGEPFELLKFRTMVDGADAMRADLVAATEGGPKLFKLREDPRVTQFGARLRRWSLDELPQLWNVLRGDMSMVGPRPLLLDEAAQVDSHFVERTRVRPGITGPWQIHGRSDIPFGEMLQLDYTYVAAWTMREDLRLMARTFSAVLHKRGAY